MEEVEKIELYKHDYVILMPPKYDDFSRFPSGEIVIYNDLSEAQKDAREVKGAVANSTGIFTVLQGILIQNIRTHRIRNSKK